MDGVRPRWAVELRRDGEPRARAPRPAQGGDVTTPPAVRLQCTASRAALRFARRTPRAPARARAGWRTVSLCWRRVARALAGAEPELSHRNAAVVWQPQWHL